MSKKITILDNNFIRQMGIYGPVTRPSTYDDAFVKKLINDGHAVFEKLDDGTSRRLTLASFDKRPAPAKAPAKEKPVVTKVEEVKEEAAPIEVGEVYNGVSETTAPTMPVKEEEPTPVATTKAQRKAQKKAKLEAKKAEAEAATEEKTEE